MKRKPKNIVGSTMRKLRYQREMTQEELARRCKRYGVILTRSTLAKIEAQIRRISDCELLVASKALDVALDQLYPANAISIIKALSVKRR